MEEERGKSELLWVLKTGPLPGGSRVGQCQQGPESGTGHAVDRLKERHFPEATLATAKPSCRLSAALQKWKCCSHRVETKKTNLEDTLLTRTQRTRALHNGVVLPRL